MARNAAAADKTLSTLPSIAVGPGCGDVKGWTETSGGRVGSTMLMQFVVMLSVAFGLMRRMRIGLASLLSGALMFAIVPLALGAFEDEVLLSYSTIQDQSYRCCYTLDAVVIQEALVYRFMELVKI
jgi:hypothetical protein